MWEICDKNISNNKYEKLRNFLLKMKNWIKLLFKKDPWLQKKSFFLKNDPRTLYRFKIGPALYN